MNDQQRAAMQGALLALEDAYRRDEHSAARWVYSEAMDDLREALAQPQDHIRDVTKKVQGKWVGLTHDEIMEMTCHESLIRYFEAKLKEKNTPKVVPQEVTEGNASEVRSTDTGEPVAYVTGTYGGRFVVEPVNRAMVLPVGMAFYTTPPSVEAMRIETLEKVAKVCDDLYKHDRKSSGYDEGWNDALDIAEQAIRSMK
jgi:hypothetical protein